MISAIIYIEHTTFYWTASVSDFSTQFLISKAKLSLVSERTGPKIFDTPIVLEQPQHFPHHEVGGK